MKNSLMLFCLLLFINQSISQFEFNPYQSFDMKGRTKSVFLEDMNNDGTPEIIILNGKLDPPNDKEYDANIIICNFSENNELNEIDKKKFYYGTNEIAVTSFADAELSDVNNDSYKDLVICFLDYLVIYFAIPNETYFDFDNPFVVDSNLYIQRGMTIGDFNNDKLNDIAVIQDGGYELKIYYNSTNTGTFGFSEFVKIGDEYRNYITSVDYNSDGYMDIVTGNYLNIKIDLQDPTLGMTVPSFIEEVGDLYFGNDLEFTDLNQDGFVDMISSIPKNSAFIHFFLYSEGSNSMEFDYTIEAYDIPQAIELADLNGDGKKEIIIVHGGWQNISIYEMGDDGKYLDYQKIDLPYATHYDRKNGLKIQDVNNDGVYDLLIADYNHGLVVLFGVNNTNGNFDYVINNYEIDLFPNPNSGLINITLNTNIETIELAVFDESGANIFYNSNFLISSQLDLRRFPKGNYFLEIRFENQTYSRKIQILE